MLFGDISSVITSDVLETTRGVQSFDRGDRAGSFRKWILASDRNPHAVDMVVDETTLSYKVFLSSRAGVCVRTSRLPTLGVSTGSASLLHGE